MAAANPERDYQVIREELEAHDPELLDKLTLVVANKMDLPEAADQLQGLSRRRARRKAPRSWPCPPRTGEGLDKLDRRARAAAARRRRRWPSRAEPPAWSSTASSRAPTPSPSSARTARFRVRGRRIERLAAQTNFDNEESAERFQRDLARLGVERELVRAGVTGGDTVRIGAVELEWDRDEERRG